MHRRQSGSRAPGPGQGQVTDFTSKTDNFNTMPSAIWEMRCQLGIGDDTQMKWAPHFAFSHKGSSQSSPWTVPLPHPSPAFEDIWESHSQSPSEQSDRTSEPRYVQLGERDQARRRHVATSQAPSGRSQEPGLMGGPLQSDPGLSGQRLKRVKHVKQAPIYQYAEWCSYWTNKGGRTSDDPMTPRSELTKSEFDVQYGAWRKALVEGPPRAPKILALEEHMR